MNITLSIEYLFDHPTVTPLIASWLHSEWGHLNPWRSVEEISQSLEQRLNQHQAPLTLIAFNELEPIGTASIKLYEMDIYPERTHWLGDVFVVTAYRGCGIGSALTKKLIEIAPSIGVSDLFLYTPDQEGLYRRLGWKTVEHISYNGEDVVVMQRGV